MTAIALNITIYDHNNVFARIIRGELPCNKVYEDDAVIAFHDIAAEAPIHVLVLPKAPFTCYSQFITHNPPEKISAFFKTVQVIIEKLGLTMENQGYRLVTNQGSNAGQTIAHFHLHILSGEPLSPRLT